MSMLDLKAKAAKHVENQRVFYAVFFVSTHEQFDAVRVRCGKVSPPLASLFWPSMWVLWVLSHKLRSGAWAHLVGPPTLGRRQPSIWGPQQALGRSIHPRSAPLCSSRKQAHRNLIYDQRKPVPLGPTLPPSVKGIGRIGACKWMPWLQQLTKTRPSCRIEKASLDNAFQGRSRTLEPGGFGRAETRSKIALETFSTAPFVHNFCDGLQSLLCTSQRFVFKIRD